MQTLKTIQAHIDRQTAGLAGRVAQSLDRDWRFYQGEATGAELTGFDDAGWVGLNVPHDFSITGEFSEKHPTSQSGGWVQAGVGWYRKRLHRPSMAPGQKVFILFDGVSMNSQVWLNGRFLGLRPSGHTPFHYDITAFLNPGDGAPNILAVRVDTSLQPYSRFYCGSGINRHVRPSSMTAAMSSACWRRTRPSTNGRWDGRAVRRNSRSGGTPMATTSISSSGTTPTCAP